MGISEAYIQAKNYLLSKGWKTSLHDGSSYFIKKESELHYRQFEPGTPNRRFITLQEGISKLREKFSGNFPEIKAIPVVGATTDTVFTSAGVQVYHAEKNLPQDFSIIQPVIRTQFMGQSGQGTATAFVNICTETAPASNGDLARHLDYWLSLLSSAGLHANDMALKEKFCTSNWQDKEFKQVALKLEYRGLELGDLCYLEKSPTLNGPQNVIDSGFGLERLCWVINRTPNFYDVIWPGRRLTRAEPAQIDALRTATLISLSGVRPSNKGQGYRFSRATQDCLEIAAADFYEMLQSFYGEWQALIPQALTLHDTQRELLQEMQRQRNLATMKRIGLEGIPAGQPAGQIAVGLLKNGKWTK